METWPKKLRDAAENMDAAIKIFEEFKGTDVEDHCEALHDAAQQFREDADEYEVMTAADAAFTSLT